MYKRSYKITSLYNSMHSHERVIPPLVENNKHKHTLHIHNTLTHTHTTHMRASAHTHTTKLHTLLS